MMEQDGSDARGPNTLPTQTVDVGEQEEVRRMESRIINLEDMVEQMTISQQRTLQEALEAHRTQSDAEMKSLREELASQRTEQQAMEPRTGSDEAHTLRKELELSKQREEEQKNRFQIEMEEAEKKHQAQIARRDKQVVALRGQLKEEKEKSEKLQAQVWKAAINYDMLAARAKQLERGKAGAIKAAEATTEAHIELTTKYRELEQQLDAGQNNRIRRKLQAEIAKRVEEVTSLRVKNEKLGRQLKDEKETCRGLMAETWKKGLAVRCRTMAARAEQLEKEKEYLIEMVEAIRRRKAVDIN